MEASNIIKNNSFIKRCTGCGACKNVCPVNAIYMLEGHNTFMYPQIDANRCINCKKCQDVCPVNNEKNENVEPNEMIAYRADEDIRKICSSGGVFPVLAYHFLQEGYAVCGAVFNSEMQLQHRLVEDSRDITGLFGSKYLQSDTLYIYRDVKDKLANGQKVLFVGTPCQVAALKNYIGVDDNNLYCIDILCHGVPSQKIFDRYIKEISNGKKVTDVEFRKKDVGWTSERIWVKYDDGSIYEKYRKDGDIYLKCFLENIDLRDCCEDCKFSEFPRRGDLSIGDFWGISKYDNTQNDGKGTSIVFSNNLKGNLLLKILKEKGLFKSYKLDKNIPNRIKAIFKHSEKKSRLFKLIEHHSLEEAINYISNDRYDIGLVCNYYASNFGGGLTQYALKRVLEKNGYSVLMIERPLNAPEKVFDVEERLYIKWPFEPCSKQYSNIEEMQELNNRCDIFIVGSDVLFRHSLWNLMGKISTLSWVYNYKTKIAYSASYGYDYLLGTENDTAEMSYYMKRFDAFSTREESGIKLFKDYFGVDAELVLDPVMLCDFSIFNEWIDLSELKTEDDKYMTAYILDITSEKLDILKYFNEKTKLTLKHIISVTYVAPSTEYLSIMNEDYPFEYLKQEDRLKVIHDCDFLVADSFHGVCLAIVFNIDFVCIVNKQRGATRFHSLLKMLQLEDRMIESYSDLYNNKEILKNIDWDNVNRILNEKRRNSLEWLKKSLNIKKPILYDDVDIFVKQKRGIIKLKNENEKLKKLLSVDYTEVFILSDYLKELSKRNNRLIIIISAKDTPGMSVNEEIAKQIMSLGSITNLENKHWYGYTTIIYKGVAIDEKCEYERKVDSYFQNSEITIETHSAPYNCENISSIKINNEEYSKNMRGLNFVVYDLAFQKVTDSVNFDTHVPNFKCSR